jgi:hypothetical protein
MARKVKEGPYVATARARKTPGKTVRKGGTQIVRLTRIKAEIPLKKGAFRAQVGGRK